MQLCPPLQFGPLTYQPIECAFISSNQSALWSCLLHVTSQLGEGCSMTFVRFVFLISWKTCVCNSFEVFPRWIFGEFYRSLKYVRNFPRSTHMFICWRGRTFELESSGQGWKHKPRAQIKSSKLRWLWYPFFTLSTDFGILADVSILVTGLGRFGLVIFAN